MNVASSVFSTALNFYNSQRYTECIKYIDVTFEENGVQLTGLHMLKALSSFALKNYGKVHEFLQRELELPAPHQTAVEFKLLLDNKKANNSSFANLANGKNKYIISGVPPGSGGAGEFLVELNKYAVENEFYILHPERANFDELDRVIVSEIKNSKVLLLHPQSLGIELVDNLIENNHVIGYFVLDNSFFCMQSYNHISNIPGECLSCLGGVSPQSVSCIPFPQSYPRDDYVNFLLRLKDNYKKIIFFCQTHHQAALIAAHFGPDARSVTVGMKCADLASTEPKAESSVASAKSKPFDIVFHGSLKSAKGFNFCVELAHKLPEYSFLMPANKIFADQTRQIVNLPSNLFFEDLNWNTGLKQRVQEAKLVLCPSEWSAPVELALLKSLLFNGAVGVLETRYGFEREIPENVILKLSRDVEKAAIAVRNFIETNDFNRECAQIWVKDYISSVNLSAIFDKINAQPVLKDLNDA